MGVFITFVQRFEPFHVIRSRGFWPEIESHAVFYCWRGSADNLRTGAAYEDYPPASGFVSRQQKILLEYADSVSNVREMKQEVWPPLALLAKPRCLLQLIKKIQNFPKVRFFMAAHTSVLCGSIFLSLTSGISWMPKSKSWSVASGCSESHTSWI